MVCNCVPCTCGGCLVRLPKIMCIDAMCLACRAGSSKFNMGDYYVMFNFLRSFKALVEEIQPTRVYVALEGHARKNFELLPEYKANRERGKDSFYEQVNVLFDLLKNYFPVNVVRHPDYEADDTIANLALNSAEAIEWVIVSTDTDFIQLIQQRKNLSVYDPIRKTNLIAPEYDYVTWKALNGDASDNIPGFKGVGPKTAAQLTVSEELREAFFNARSPEDRVAFERNLKLVKFWRWSEEEAMKAESSLPKRDWDAVMVKFEEWAFASMLKPSYWDKFVKTFEPLWGSPLWQLD